MNEVFLVLDCPKSRRKDLATISAYTNAKYGLKTLLLVEQALSIFESVCDEVIEVNLSDPNLDTLAAELLKEYRVCGGIIFADKALQYGTVLFERLGIICDSTELALNAFNKATLRSTELEHFSSHRNEHHFIPAFAQIYSLQDLQAFATRFPDGFILKPTCGSASRGVLKLDSQSDLSAAYRQVECYLESGLMCEERIPTFSEFSFDGVGDVSFITEKIVAKGTYPVEIGQVLPAGIDISTTKKIEAHGRLMNGWVGQNVGAFHNEIAYLDHQGLTATVEANRRSAGMGIWNLANKVFGVNFFHLWVDLALGNTVTHTPLSPKGKAMSCMLGATEALLDDISDFTMQIEATLREELGHKIELFSLDWLNTRPLSVPIVPRSNDEFIAQANVYCSNSELSTESMFEQVQLAWERSLYSVKKGRKCS
ncbi:hypothetical protein OE749_07080 [Aestuariibacter sp. AA17]|uniref:ATP-grasp domain-containing protein n=1 Tax=Fluctibacter corallii TaxID=2984329 RepID=A0ABT3A715_9ALTE|nr:hypothetical protein [Aestuariibacter sp. AA17]MCV2884453.1 hypothetical protein [Aestuariibacter sp. AA17]